ncbi:hypothetical protein [Bradyrhizobium sp. 139]|uniref:hypothetical protein n=1 Tax=Bradyrhizobium sp. 139 TaxID=2782616 RepID=UPI0031FE83EC
MIYTSEHYSTAIFRTASPTRSSRPPPIPAGIPATRRSAKRLRRRGTRTSDRRC